ncbi:MAG TPA: EAL domain-containing protein, partial [Desulfuromonadales bacterium]|nr:EAL domain-containing protein [Desulfuromonadales bacterium]
IEELLESECQRFYPDEETYAHVGELARQILRDGHGVLKEVPYRRLDGKIIYSDLSGQKLSRTDGVERIIWTQVDVTERHANEQTIRALSAARATLLANTTAGIDIVRYPERVFMEVNQGFLDLLGYENKEDIIGHPTSEFYPSQEQIQRMIDLSQDVLAKGQGGMRDLILLHKDGRTVYVDVSGQRLDDEDPEHPVIVWTSVNVTERHRLTEELARQAHIDALTGLPNRRALEKEFEKAMARAKRHDHLLAVAMIDLDNFKQVNDTYGHNTGDLVLKVVGRRLQETLRRTDFVVRLGGDEFILLIEDCNDVDEIRTVLDKVGQAVQEPMTFNNGGIVSLQLSGGVCLYPAGGGENPDLLLKHADLALYKNKAYKEDRLRFWTLYGEDTPRQRTRVQKLLYDGALRIYYQPILDNRSGKIVGAEALARLQDEDGLILSPGEFLPQLETDDLFELSFKVLAQALNDLGTLDRQGFPLWVSVNVDPRNISAAFVARLRDLLAETKIAPERIYLELLEGGTFVEHQLALEHLHALKAQGIRLALDDVGSAYSSLLRLKELPIDKVKLDQSFVRTLEERPQDLQFVEAILDLANGLGRELVVEGVETEDILDAMSVLGVTAMQGYGIAPPLPFAKLQDMICHPSSHHRQHPTSLMGIYAKLLSNHSSRKKAIQQNLHSMDHLTLADHTRCPIHADLLRLGIEENDVILQRHRDYHRVLGDLVDKVVGSPFGDGWSNVEIAIKALLEVVIASYRERKGQRDDPLCISSTAGPVPGA